MKFSLKREPTITIGIIGLGLIGGSLAKAFNKYTPHYLFGGDSDPRAVEAALECGSIDEAVCDNDVSECDLVFLALYPRQAVEFVVKNIREFKPGAMVIDLCGIKRQVVNGLHDLCKANGLQYIGGHPMAGKEFWGFEHSEGDLYQNATMILTPKEELSPAVKEFLSGLFADIGFRQINETTPEAHDRMIAFTSQLAHVVSSAYVKSPSAREHHGFSAGSYKDLTRVAKLNPDMWTELFLENSDDLVREIDTLMTHLTEYRQAIAGNDEIRLHALLEDGRKIKEELDHETNSSADRSLFHLH